MIPTLENLRQKNDKLRVWGHLDHVVHTNPTSICIFIHTHKRIYAHTHMHTRTNTYICIHTYMCTHTNTRVYMHIHAYIRIHAYTQTHTYMCMHTCIYAYTRIYAYTHVCTCSRTHTHKGPRGIFELVKCLPSRYKDLSLDSRTCGKAMPGGLHLQSQR